MGKVSPVLETAPGGLDGGDSLARYWRQVARRGIDFRNASQAPDSGSIMGRLRG